MSARVTRKRSRAEENEEDLPPAKREPDQDDPEHPEARPVGNAQADGEERDGQVLKEDGEFWFEDGTVILVARDIVFRVYRGVLARLSSVLKTQFGDRGHEVRNVRIDEEQTISCPVVRLSDSPEDLRYLLRACFSGRLESLYEEREPSYYEISAAIRLGDKYKIAEWHAQSLAYLKCHYPSSFDCWTAQEYYGPPNWGSADALGAVNLARKTGELSILPSAFIACICTDSDNLNASGIGHGILLEDGCREHLSPNDLTVCLSGTANLRTATVAAVFRTFRPVVSAECKTSAACKKALRDVLVNLGDDVGHLLTGSPFAGYETYVNDGDLAVCPSCTTMVEERSMREHKDAWNRLPELLGIDVPGWGEQSP